MHNYKRIVLPIMVWAMLATTEMATAQRAFYGATQSNAGGADNYGVLFRYVPTTSTYSDVFHCNASDGNTISGMVRVGDLLYGTTAHEGLNGAGTVFSFDPLTETFTKLADFDSINGKWPTDDMVPAPDGKLYGVTSYGGNTNSGVLFSFDPTTNTITKLHDFQPGPFTQPMAGMMMGSNGHLYGMTSYYYGGLFEYDIDADNFQYIFDFPSTNAGRVPWGKLTEVQDSVFYGCTRYGGSGNQQTGTLFRYDQRDDSFTTIKYFVGGADGEWPMEGFVHVGNVLYGFTHKGGDYTYGTFFKYDLVQEQFTKLVDLDYPIGAYPESRPILGSDGKIYCPTKSGGNLGSGSLTKFDIVSGIMTNIHTFQSGTGTYPHNALIESCITPTPTGTASINLCQGATVANLSANGSGVKWYNSASSTTALASTTALTSGTYYATQTVQCESTGRLAIVVTLQSPPDVGVTLDGQTITVNEPAAQYQWINCLNNSNVIGANQQAFTPSANGEFKVRVTIGPCMATSTCTTIDDVSVNELDMTTVAIYPNPTGSDINIESEQVLQLIELLDNKGRLISSLEVNALRFTLPMNTLATGIYRLNITDKDGLTGQQVVVKE